VVDSIRTSLVEYRRHSFPVANVGLDQLEAVAREAGGVRFLDAALVEGVVVVDAHDPIAAIEQRPGHV
jgi:hypothetical protein